MTVVPKEISVPVTLRDSVTALLYLSTKPPDAQTTLILAHGAGANQLSGFMRMFAAGLAERDVNVLTFNFLYIEQGRRSPDPKARLESCYRAVITAALELPKVRGTRLIIGGKSMGGRIGSQVAAAPSDEVTDAVSGLVFLGYPLHPPGKPEQMRDKHLKEIRAPMLFIQGTRDAFGTAEEIQLVINRLKLNASLKPIEGGDHSFKVPKSSPISQQQVYEDAMLATVEWVGQLE